MVHPYASNHGGLDLANATTATELCCLAPMLYVPADWPGLEAVLGGTRNLGVCCLAICLEDAVHPGDRATAALNLCRVLENLENAPRPIFIRPADTGLLEQILQLAPLERIAGFILPKATVANIDLWVTLTRGRHTILPILETHETLDPGGRRDLAQSCAAQRHVIPVARVGANDLFSLLGGLRRPRGRTIYETPVGHVIDALLESFCIQSVRLCGSVFDRTADQKTLLREVTDDIQRGLFAKTALNPSQVETIWRAYQPAEDELEEARQILDPEAPAVFTLNGSMLEPTCHAEWARRLTQRAALHQRAQTGAFPGV